MVKDSPKQCPSCGKLLPSYRKLTPYCDYCGWKADPQPSAKQPQDKLSAVTSRLQDLGDQASSVGSWAKQKGDRSGILGILSQKSLYAYLVWGLSAGLPWLAGPVDITSGSGWLIIVLALLNWSLLFASARNLEFPFHRLPPLISQVLLAVGPFMEKINVSGSRNRPAWSAIAVWLVGILLVSSWALSNFGVTLMALVMALMSFLVLLFP